MTTATKAEAAATSPSPSTSSDARSGAPGGDGLDMPHTDHHPQPYNGPSHAEVLAMRKEYCNPAITALYREPLMIVE